MLRLCKKCSSRLKKIDSNDDFTTWECSNPDCKEVFTFPVEKKAEETKEVKEDKIVLNIRRFNKETNTAESVQISKVVTSTEDGKKEIKNFDEKEEAKKQENDDKEKLKINIPTTSSSNQIKEETTTQKLQEENKVVTSSLDTQKVENSNTGVVKTQQETKLQEVKTQTSQNETQTNQTQNTSVTQSNTTQIKEEPKLEQEERKVKVEDPIITTAYDDLNEKFVDDGATSGVKLSDALQQMLANQVGEYNPYTIDLDAEDARFPLNWTEETQYQMEENPGRQYHKTQFACPYCGSTKFGVTVKITHCLDCGNKYLNQRIESELYYALVEAVKLRQRSNFKDAENIIQEMISRYPSEDLCDALFALGIAQSNIIFRENVKTGKKFATVYEPSQVPFLQNQNVIRALNTAKLQSKIKYEALKKLADDINASSENFNSILDQNGRYTVFICYRQSQKVSSFTKDLLKDLSRVTRTFVVGKVNEIVDENNDLMSKIYYGLHTSKIMILLCSSKEDLESPSVIWRYKTFLSVNREKYIIPVLMNGFKFEDLPQELKGFEPIVWDDYVILNIQKKIHQLLPHEYITQDYLEDRLNKIEDCLTEEKYIEAERRADRLLLNFRENPYVYFYKLLAKNNLNREEEISKIHEDLKDNEDFIKAKRYADDDLLGRLIRYEYNNTKLQTLRKREAKKENIKRAIVDFFTKPTMQYLYTTIVPVLLGLIIMFTKEPFANIHSVYLFLIAGILTMATMVLICVCKFKAMTMVSMVAAMLFLFGTTCLSRIQFLNTNGTLYSYTINAEDKTVCLDLETSILSSTQNPELVKIPETVKIYGETYKVTEIGESLFENCQNIEKIVISKNITKIHPYAFKNIQATIEFAEDSVMTEIGDYAFSGYKGFEILNLPKNLKRIGNYAFDDCDIMDSNLSNTQPYYAFELPKSVTYIGEYAFSNVYCDVKFHEDAVITEIGSYAFANFKGKFELPSSVRKIKKFAFYGTSIPSLKIPSGGEEIELSAFEGIIKLKVVELPLVIDSAYSYTNTSVFASYFGGNEKINALTDLLSVKITNATNNVIPKNAFKDCGKIRVVNIYSDTITKIGEMAFYNAENLEQVCMYTTKDYVLNTSITSIDSQAFKNCKKLTSNPFLIPQNLTVLGANAFENCLKLKNIIIPETLNDIGLNAFMNCPEISSVFILKYIEMSDVLNENRFSTKLMLTSNDLGKMFVNSPDIYVCEDLLTITKESITYKYFDENQTEITLVFNVNGPLREADKEGVSEQVLNILYYNTMWKLYTTKQNNG